jgi:thimet oligopeptidase
MHPEALTEACTRAQSEADAQVAALIAVPAAQRTFASSFDAYDAILGEVQSTLGSLGFLKDVHGDEKVRAAAAACEASGNRYLVRLGARVDLYQALKSYADGTAKTAGLTPVQQRLVFLTLRDFHRNGLDLSEADRAKRQGGRPDPTYPSYLSLQTASYLNAYWTEKMPRRSSEVLNGVPPLAMASTRHW